MAAILLATADAAIIATAQPILEASGHTCILVDSGPAVLHYTGAHACDLYLLAYDLPQMPGLRVARHLQQSYHVARDHIILLYPAALPPTYDAEIQAATLLPTPFTGVELLLAVMRRLPA